MAENSENFADGLTRDQDDVAVAYAVGMSVKELSEVSLVPERTLYAWIKLPAFVSRVREVRSGLRSSVSGKLTEGQIKVHAKLMELLDNPDARVRLAAIRIHHEMTRDYLVIEELQGQMMTFDSRLKAIEEGEAKAGATT